MAVKNDYITVAYKLYTSDGEGAKEELTEECTSAHPFMFISKLGCVLPAFEEAIAPLSAGDSFDFVIPSGQAYGDFVEDLVQEVPKSIFMVNGKFDTKHIYEGSVVPLQSEDGSRFNGVILEVKNDTVTVDLNHPYAGQDLHFVGTVVTHREATDSELTDMLNSLGGCCGGGCSGGCDSCGSEKEGCGGCGGCE